ncbi:unnamed protein product [Heterobilharzia americana]|nr:unnamed protein product [Heterobilharzia americana]
MVCLLENVIIVTENDNIKHNLASVSKHFSVSHFILQLDPAKLMDEQFIAGFCRRGFVTVLPLKPLPDFRLSIEKSILTLDMSPIVYSGFGLSAKKIKRSHKQFFYRFQAALNTSNFQRNGPLHLRLRSFFKAFTNPAELGTRVPRRLADLGPFFVDWLPDSSNTLVGEFPNAGSIVSYLNNEEHIVVRPHCEILDYNGPCVLLPDFVSWEKVPFKQEESSTTSIKRENPPDFLNFANIQLGLTVLSYLATGISFPHTAASTCVPSDNPCLTNCSLSPIYSQTISEIISPVYELKQLKIVHLSGLFPDYYCDELEDQIKSVLIEDQCENELVYLCKCPLKTSDSLQSFKQPAGNSGTLFVTGIQRLSDSQSPPVILVRF